MNIALTGFMGAGKTTTGKRLARLLHMDFLDTDAEIERRHGPITEIFASRGEPAFRRLEAVVIAELANAGPYVLAVGGGAVLDANNRSQLRRNGFIVNLAISPVAAWQRVSRRRHRPLLGDHPDLPTVTALLNARAVTYADCDLAVRVDHRTPAATAHIIARWYERQRGRRVASR